MTASPVGRVAGKRVLITGAARGMGRSHALRLAEEGADLILVDICQSLTQIDYPLATEDDLTETVRLAREARMLAGSAPSSPAALGAAAEARALARMGDHQAARVAPSPLGMGIGSGVPPATGTR